MLDSKCYGMRDNFWKKFQQSENLIEYMEPPHQISVLLLLLFINKNIKSLHFLW